MKIKIIFASLMLLAIMKVQAQSPNQADPGSSEMTTKNGVTTFGGSSNSHKTGSSKTNSASSSKPSVDPKRAAYMKEKKAQSPTKESSSPKHHAKGLSPNQAEPGSSEMTTKNGVTTFGGNNSSHKTRTTNQTSSPKPSVDPKRAAYLKEKKAQTQKQNQTTSGDNK